jgi:putative ATP-dependent endonuclease of the OLD family
LATRPNVSVAMSGTVSLRDTVIVQAATVAGIRFGVVFVLLASVATTNYRCLKSVEVRFGTQSLLIGGNGAGKSSIIEAIDKVFGVGRRGYGFAEEDLSSGATELVVDFEIRPDDGTQFSPEEHALFETHVDIDAEGNEVVRVRVVAGFEEDGLFRSRGEFVKEDGDSDGILDADTRTSIAFFYLPAARDARREFEDRAGLWSRIATMLEQADDPERLADLTAAAGRDLVEAVLGEERLDNVATTVAGFLSVMYGSGLQAELRATAIDFRTLLRRTALVVGNGAEKTPLEQHSTGLQTLALFGLFTAYLETSGGILLAAGLEEPEIHLAPHVARSLVNRTRGSGRQVVFTSHSPAISDRIPISDITVLRRTDNGTVARRVQAGVFDDEELQRIQRELGAIGTEFLFARSVLFSEGPSETGAIPEFAAKCGVDFDLLGVSIVSINGGGFKPWLKLCGPDGFDIPHAVLCDNDANLPKLVATLDQLGRLPTGIDPTQPIGAAQRAVLATDGYLAWSEVDLESYLVAEGGYAHFEEAADFLYGAGNLAAFRTAKALTDDAETIRKYVKRRSVRKPELAAECARRFATVPEEMMAVIEHVASLATASYLTGL